MERNLNISDDSLSEKDQKKEQKDLAKLKKINDSKSAVKKPLSAYEIECNEIIEKLNAKKKPKEEVKAVPNFYNKPKAPSPERQYLGGLEIKKVVSENIKRKKIQEDINHNHIEREKRMLELQQDNEYVNGYVSKSARKKTRKKKEKKPSKPADKNIDSWKSYTQFPKPASNQIPTPNISIPQTQPKPFNLSSSQYQISLKLFLK